MKLREKARFLSTQHNIVGTKIVRETLKLGFLYSCKKKSPHKKTMFPHPFMQLISVHLVIM